MELTLIPIAAILLLLTGFSTPAQPAMDAVSSAAVLRFWLTRERTQSSHRRTQRTQVGVACPVAWGKAKNDVQAVLSDRAHRTARHLSRALLRTRFGVASGAYRSTAPPARA